jgi:hypothetical protein
VGKLKRIDMTVMITDDKLCAFVVNVNMRGELRRTLP